MTYFCRRIFKPSISSVLSPILRKQGLFKKANEWRAPMLEWSFCCQDTEVKMHLSSSTPLSELTLIKMVNCFQEITMNRCNSISRNNIRNLDNMAKVWLLCFGRDKQFFLEGRSLSRTLNKYLKAPTNPNFHGESLYSETVVRQMSSYEYRDHFSVVF